MTLINYEEEDSDVMAEAKRAAMNTQASIDNPNDMIAEDQLQVLIQLGQLHALIEIARQLREITSLLNQAAQ
jgi:hypothetical protein